jgi:5-methylcytosine-specific restriction endonuclease McrA
MKLSDRLYGEMDDPCAICGIRGVGILTEHHIDGDRSNEAYDNRIVLCQNCHHSYHSNSGLKHEQIVNHKRHLGTV